MEGECPPGLGSVECWEDTVWLILRASVSFRTILNGTWLDAPTVFSALLFVVLVDLASHSDEPLTHNRPILDNNRNTSLSSHQSRAFLMSLHFSWGVGHRCSESELHLKGVRWRGENSHARPVSGRQLRSDWRCCVSYSTEQASTVIMVVLEDRDGGRKWSTIGTWITEEGQHMEESNTRFSKAAKQRNLIIPISFPLSLACPSTGNLSVICAYHWGEFKNRHIVSPL